MRRGEIWIVTGRDDFLSKPRPAIVLQGDRVGDLISVTVCPLTTDHLHGPSIRISIEPTQRNGLDAPSRIMVDRIATVQKSRLSTRIGRLEDMEMAQLSRAIIRFLELAVPESE